MEMKNYSPLKISLLASVILSFLSPVILFIVSFPPLSVFFTYNKLHVGENTNAGGISVEYYFIVPLSVFILSFTVIYFIFKKFFYNDETFQWVLRKKKEMERIEQLEAYRKEFVGNVSHELKTPIFSVQGYIHTLLDGAIEDKKVNMVYLQKAANSIERLCAIVEDLETISQLESDTLSLDLKNFDVVEMVKEIFDSLEMRAKEKNIFFEIIGGSDKKISVHADKEKIRQVLINLIVNSIKYGKENGKTSVQFYDMNDKIMTEVTDNGIGIAEEHLVRLFERFYRVDKSRSREEGGTGLGLAIVKHIIEAHHETINVRSTEGVGTTFGFTLEKSKE